MSMPYRLRNAREDDERVENEKETPRNPVLAANMRRLMKGRSIGALRAEMAQAGYAIGTGTLHRACLGMVGNRLESLEKIAAFFDTTAEQLLRPEGLTAPIWPFSLELQEQILQLEPKDLHHAEVAMWAHLRKPVPQQLHYEDEGKSSHPDVQKPSTIVSTRNAAQAAFRNLPKQK